MSHTRMGLPVILFLLLLLVGAERVRADDGRFPMPGVIAPNVHFWINVFAGYGTNQGILHDSEDLGRIYGVIDLIAYDQPDPARENRERIRAALAHYRAVLERLSRHPDCTRAESRRVAALFAPEVDPRQYRAAAARLRCQIGQRDRFEAGLIRSGAYMAQIREILRSHGVPEDLAYLPHVESAFDPDARSHVGALGMWQFMPATGRRFMTVGYAVDERRDPTAATYAAAALLRENYAQLGSWPLAVTAYNHGTNGMLRAKAQHGADFEAIYRNYRAPSFGFASRNFYAEFLAARQVAANYRLHFGDLVFDRPEPVRTLLLEGYAAFDDLSRYFGVPPETLRRMNRSLGPPILSGRQRIPKGFTLRLPLQAEDAITAAVPEPLLHAAQVPSRYYTVRPGDTAYRIARRNDVPVADLIAINGLDRNATIRPRQVLRIPGRGEQVQAAMVPAVLGVAEEGAADTACDGTHPEPI